MSINTLRKKLEYQGGDAIGRIRVQKYRSFKSALKNDYNSRTIEILSSSKITKALVNLNNLKSDYDKKYVSVGFDAGLEPGDVFRTLDDNTYWMIYLQDLAEVSYLRAEIIRCRYNIEINGKLYWIYLQGPTETDVPWEQKKSINFNDMNMSGTIYIKNDENTKEFFHRFTKFKMAGHNWKVSVTDYITVPGILEVEIAEDFDNLAEELPEIIKQKPLYLDDEHIESIIIGKTEVQQNSIVGYTIQPEAYDKKWKWEVRENVLVEIVETFEDDKICKVKVNKGATGYFDLVYGDNILRIDIDITESDVKGEKEVYPYSIHTYECYTPYGGVFVIDNDNARIIEQHGGQCTVEVMASKRCGFRVMYEERETGEVFELPVKVLSM